MKRDASQVWYWRRLVRVSWTERRSNKTILKEINPEYSLEGLMLKLQSCGHLMWTASSLEKTLMLAKIRVRRRQGRQRKKGLDGIINSWVCANFRAGWRTGKPGMLQSMGLQSAGLKWTTEQQQQWEEIKRGRRGERNYKKKSKPKKRQHEHEGKSVSHWVMSDSFNHMDCSLSSSSIHRILQARILEWISIYILIIALTTNGLNAPTKGHRLAEWIQKQDPWICCLQNPTSDLGTHTDWKWENEKKLFDANRNRKKAQASTLIIKQINVKIKTTTRDKGGHHMRIKGSTQEKT